MKFVNKEIQNEYDDLFMREEDLLDELKPIQERLRIIEATEERA